MAANRGISFILTIYRMTELLRIIYPLEIEMQIINNIKSGNIDKSIELFNKVIEENSENK